MGYDKLNPCLGCTERVPDPNCHDTCERYFDSLVLNEKKKAARKKDTECLSALIEGVERAKTKESSKTLMKQRNNR